MRLFIPAMLLPGGALARIAKVLKPKESRTVFVAKAVEAALKRREKRAFAVCALFGFTLVVAIIVAAT